MSQHEIYTFGPGMRIYDENGVLQDPLTSGGGGSGSGLLLVTTNLTVNDILNLDSVFHELAPAPAAGELNAPIGVWLDVTAGTAYTLVGVNLWVGYANDPLGDGTLIQIPAANLNAPTYSLTWWSLNGASGFPQTCKGQALVLAATGPITGGTGTAKVHTLYSVV